MKPMFAKIGPRVAILLCTHQGQRFLSEQLDSFERQTHTNWEVWASDDASADGTVDVLRKYQLRWGFDRLNIKFGPDKGFAANFLSLACRSGIDADYFAYSDQDDIWEPGKLARAVKWLDTISADLPALYCSRTRLVNAKNDEIGMSPLFRKPPSFSNSLVQNIGGGNTMVFNRAARHLLCEAGEGLPVITHDWWTYMLVAGCGGNVFYDNAPTLRYRQHDGNLVGMNSTWPARLKRLRKLWRGRFRDWNTAHISALRTMHHRLTPENLNTLETFSKAREMGFFPRLAHFKRTGIYRQTLLGNFGLLAAILFRKI